MTTEPITLFAKSVDPVHVFRVLNEVSPKVQFEGGEQNWTKAVVSMGLWRFKKRLLISHDPTHYSEPNWSNQMDGLRGYLSRFPDVPQRHRAMELTRQFAFSLTTMVDPDFSRNDYRLMIIQILAKELEAVWFTPSSLRDHTGRILLGTQASDIDPEAMWPSYAHWRSPPVSSERF